MNARWLKKKKKYKNLSLKRFFLVNNFSLKISNNIQFIFLVAGADIGVLNRQKAINEDEVKDIQREIKKIVALWSVRGELSLPENNVLLNKQITNKGTIEFK